MLSSKKFSTALVIGSGAFGTSTASVISQNFEKVIIKVRSPEVYEDLKKGQNSLYLPNRILPSNIVPALSWEEIENLVEDNEKIELIISGLPSSAIKSYCEENYEPLQKLFDLNIPFVSLSKGIDPDTLELPDDLLMHSFAPYRDLFCFLSGPSFAQEILDKQITLVSLAGRSREVLMNVSKMMQTDYFSVFYTYDIKGLLLGGALKNILAIAGGVVEGLGYNHNTRAALITRGIVEMLKFGVVFNARPETFYGLSGMGDLILTMTGDLSRNKSFGLEVAKGRSPEEIIRSQRSVVEGYKTAKATKLLADRYKIKAKIFEGIYSVLYENADPLLVIAKLMKLSSRFEVT